MGMTRECIEEFRKIVIPFVRKRLLEIDYENLGRSDAEEFTRDFNEILNLAIKALEQEPKTGHWIFVGEENEEETRNGNFRYICSECTYSDVHAKSTEVPYCWHCGAKMVEPQESENKE